jgi:hypothetical protein
LERSNFSIFFLNFSFFWFKFRLIIQLNCSELWFKLLVLGVKCSDLKFIFLSISNNIDGNWTLWLGSWKLWRKFNDLLFQIINDSISVFYSMNIWSFFLPPEIFISKKLVFFSQSSESAFKESKEFRIAHWNRIEVW